MSASERDLLQRAIQRFTVRRTKTQLNALIDLDPDAYHDADGKRCRFPQHVAQLYPCGETVSDRQVAESIAERASELQGIALLQNDLVLTSAQRVDLARRGPTEQEYLDWRLVGARGLARHNVLAALRSSRAALVEHLHGTSAACSRFGLVAPKSTETGDVLGTLNELPRRGPPAVAFEATGPDWLHDPSAYAEACARETALYEEIGRLASELSDARERAKVDLLARLGREHGVVLAL